MFSTIPNKRKTNRKINRILHFKTGHTQCQIARFQARTILPFRSCVGPSGILRSSSDSGNKNQDEKIKNKLKIGNKNQKCKQIFKMYYENMGFKYRFEKNNLYVDHR